MNSQFHFILKCPLFELYFVKSYDEKQIISVTKLLQDFLSVVKSWLWVLWKIQNFVSVKCFRYFSLVLVWFDHKSIDLLPKALQLSACLKSTFIFTHLNYAYVILPKWNELVPKNYFVFIFGSRFQNNSSQSSRGILKWKYCNSTELSPKV